MQAVQRGFRSVRVAVGAEEALPTRWPFGPFRAADGGPAAPRASCPDTVVHPTGLPTWEQICDVLRDRASLPEEDLAE
jgi:hypothetical protein